MLGNKNAYLVFLLCLIATGLFACHRKMRVMIPGYIEGRYTYISSNSTGIIKDIYINPGDIVKTGQALFTLESLPESADLQAAKARVQEATNQINKIESNFNLQKNEISRKQYLYKKEVITKEELDASTSNYLEAYADMKAAQSALSVRQADLSKAEWATQQKVIHAPVTSLVFDSYYTKGEFVPSGNPVVALLAPLKIKIIFFVPETLLSHINLKQTIEMTCDGCKNPMKGTITYIANNAEYTPPIIYSKEIRENLVYRVEALPQVDGIFEKVHPGQPVSVNIYP